jgi:hypothetical protein
MAPRAPGTAGRGRAPTFVLLLPLGAALGAFLLLF